jgi:hypothetical protein
MKRKIVYALIKWKESLNRSPLIIHAMHQTAIDLYKSYILIGGMPQSVMEYLRVEIASAPVSNGYAPYYWESQGKAEVDFFVFEAEMPSMI